MDNVAHPVTGDSFHIHELSVMAVVVRTGPARGGSVCVTSFPERTFKRVCDVVPALFFLREAGFRPLCASRDPEFIRYLREGFVSNETLVTLSDRCFRRGNPIRPQAGEIPGISLFFPGTHAYLGNLFPVDSEVAIPSGRVCFATQTGQLRDLIPPK